MIEHARCERWVANFVNRDDEIESTRLLRNRGCDTFSCEQSFLNLFDRFGARSSIQVFTKDSAMRWNQADEASRARQFVYAREHVSVELRDGKFHVVTMQRNRFAIQGVVMIMHGLFQKGSAPSDMLMKLRFAHRLSIPTESLLSRPKGASGEPDKLHGVRKRLNDPLCEISFPNP